MWWYSFEQEKNQFIKYMGFHIVWCSHRITNFLHACLYLSPIFRYDMKNTDP